MDDNESKKISVLLSLFYKYEKFIKAPPQNKIYKGYLIDKNIMDSFKNSIFHEELKPQITENYEFTNVKKKLEGKGKIEKIKPIIQTKFNNANELKQALDNNKKFVVIYFALWSKICKPENKNEEGITFLFNEGKIFITFNNNETLSFNINNGILEKNNNNLIKTQKIRAQSSRQNNKKIVLKKNTERIKIEKTKIELINKEEILYDINLDSYSCINCKSPIELKAIQFKDDNNQDLIIFNCMEKCGIISITIKEFFQKIINNIYLNEKCSECGKMQLNEYIKNKNIFIYCFNCGKIICNECKERKNKCEHINCININKLKNKCLIHKNSDLYGYCFNEKKKFM